MALAVPGSRIKVLGAGVTAIVLSGAVWAVPAAAGGPARPQAASPAWRTCTGEHRPPQMRCASIRVPVDWSRPDGRKITLPIAALPATGTRRRIGTVFAVPGGPGGSGIDDLEKAAGGLAQLRRRFDVVSFVPRNSPDLRLLPWSCVTQGPPTFQPKNRTEYATLARDNRRSAQRCRTADPEYFDHLDSASVARDIDAIRAALGERRLSLLATSYGGMPAHAYARLFPARVRAVYLDGTVGPRADRAAWDRDVYRDSEQHFARFVQWCAAASACRLHGSDVRAVWRRLVDRADRTPIPVRDARTGTAFSGYDLKVAAEPSIRQPGPAPEVPRWRQLAEAIDRARRGDASGFADYVKEATAGNLKVPSPPYQYAVQCADANRYANYAAYVADKERAQRLSPDFAGVWQRTTLACVGWPTPVTNPPRPLTAAALPPCLAAGTLADSVNLPAQVEAVPGSSIIRYQGYGHGLYVNDGDPCVIAHANRYFTYLKPPPDGALCRPAR